MKIRCGGCFALFDSDFEICPECGHYAGKPAKEPYQLYPGVVLANRYTIGNVLGFGGFGVTYKAYDKKLDSIVCIKEYYPSGIVNRPPGTNKLILFSGAKKKEFEYGLVRFIDEARNMTKFNVHKNIVNVYEYFEENNTAYIVMEFLDGCTLSEFMEDDGGRLDQDTSIDIIMSIGNALKDVHDNGIIHRDVSPDNVFMCKDGTIKLIDFGAARFSSEEAKNFTIILKPGFAPPEQYEQISDQGPKTDIYALGATLYYMITGVKPDESTNRKIKDVLQEPNEIVPDIPQHVNDTILKAMSIEPSLRFESVDEFEKSLRKEIKVTSLKKEKRTRKTKRLIGILSLLIVLSAAGTVFGLNMQKKHETVALKPASIQVWYIAKENDSTDKAYKAIVSQFREEYKNVKVKCVPIAAEEYTQKLGKALGQKDGPNLFISNDLSFAQLQKTEDLGRVLYPESEENKLYFLINILTRQNLFDCYFLQDYDSQFPEHKQVPTSFNVPVLYVNKSLVTEFSETKISDFSKLKEYINDDRKLAVNTDMQDTFRAIFGVDLGGNIIKGTKEQFVNGNLPFYFSDTSEYYECREILGKGIGGYSVVELDFDRLPCVYNTYWSIYPTTENQNAAAERLLTFLFSEFAQTTICGRKDSEHALPINRGSMNYFVSEEYGYTELKFIKSNMNKYSFDPTEKR